MTDSYKEFKRNFAAKRCIAIFLESPENKVSELMGAPLPSSRGTPMLDPMNFKPLDELELLSSTSEIFKINGLKFIGDLITRTEVQLVEELEITEKQLNDILDILAIYGLIIGMTIEAWQIESAKYR